MTGSGLRSGRPSRPTARRLAALIALVCGMLVFGAAPSSARPLVGVSVAGTGGGTAGLADELATAQAVGSDVVRVDVSWSELEPQAPGERDAQVLAELDAVAEAARQRNLRLVLLLTSTPCWTSTAPARLRDGCREGVSNYPPSDYAAYGRLAAFLAGRYRGALAALEVWNEPDQSNERYWAGPDKVRRYVALVRSTYPLVKATDPALPVLVGSFVGTDGRWLDALYGAGIKGFYDGLSVHFYDLPLLGLRTTRAVQLRHGDRAPLWLLETGYNSCAPAKRGLEGQPCVTRAVQARNLADLVGQTRRTSYLKAVVVYKLRDDPVDRFGLITQGGARKPAFGAVRAAFGASRPPAVTPLRLRVRRKGRGLAASGSGPEGDIFTLEVRQRGTPRFRARFRLRADGTFSIAVPASLGVRGLEVRLTSGWHGSRTTRI